MVPVIVKKVEGSQVYRIGYKFIAKNFVSCYGKVEEIWK